MVTALPTWKGMSAGGAEGASGEGRGCHQRSHLSLRWVKARDGSAAAKAPRSEFQRNG